MGCAIGLKKVSKGGTMNMYDWQEKSFRTGMD